GPCAVYLATSAVRRVRESRFVNTKAQLAIAAETERKGLVYHDFVIGCVLQVNVSHRDCDVTVDLDAILGSVIIVPNFDPPLARKARVLREVWIAAYKVGNRTLPRVAEGVLAKCQGRLEENYAFGVVIKGVNQIARGRKNITAFCIHNADMNQAVA